MIPRNLETLLKKSKKSILLLGPRQTGKSTLMRALKPDIQINLADETTYLDFAKNPRELQSRIDASSRNRLILIDEVQRLPQLLNTVQVLIDEKKHPIKFLLTGSSARKLRRGQANLLPGRIHHYMLSPLTASELHFKMDVKKALSLGTLPGIWTESEKMEQLQTLKTYAAVYVKEEIQAEALTRDIAGFSRFLFFAAAEAGKFLDLTKLSSEAAIPRASATRLFEILEDTLIVRRCSPFRHSERKRLVQSPRFFFFDTGVLNGMLGNFEVSSDRIGLLFEHFVFNQLHDGAASKGKDIRLSTYRTEHGAEVDFILEMEGKITAIEVKASTNIGASDLRGFDSFSDYFGKKHRQVIAYLGTVPKKINSVDVLPWQMLLQELGF